MNISQLCTAVCTADCNYTPLNVQGKNIDFDIPVRSEDDYETGTETRVTPWPD